MEESRFRIERKIVREITITKEEPKEAIEEKKVYRSLLAVAYDTPLGRVIDCRVWIHTTTPSVTDYELEQILRDFLDWLFSQNEAAAMKISEMAVEYDREVNQLIEPDEIAPPDALLNEQYGFAEMKGSYSYHAQGKPFRRVMPTEVPE